MNTRLLIAALVLTPLIFLVPGWTSEPTPPPASLLPAGVPADSRVYDLDQSHSSVLFRIKHLDVAWFYGRFNKVTGSFNLDKEALATSHIKIEVETKSLDTNSAGRDQDMKSQGWLAASQFPTLSFESTKVENGTAGAFKITGDLKFRGKTRSVSFKAQHTGSGKVHDRFGYRTGYEAKFSIKRSDFGMSRMLKQKMLGDEIKLMISLEGIPRK